jgi:hypothetical protein
MSLQHAAKHLEKHGRNGDTVLVHMSKGEVKSLNDLAMAGGGHLTINPHTGLPEAGFLQRMLPMAIGAGLTVASGGALSPLAAAMIVGGGYAASTGSVKKGLMAGLGAYGGAGMGASFAEAGASSVVPEATAAAPAPVAEIAATPVAPAPVVVDPATSMRGGFSTATAPAATTTPGVTTNPPPFASNATTLKAQQDFLSGASPAPAPVTTTSQPVINSNSPSFQQQPGTLELKNMTPAQRFEAMKSGASFDNLGKFASNNKYTTIGMGASAIMPYDEDKKEAAPTPGDSDPGQQFNYQANATTPTPTPNPYGQEQKYFNQRYVARAADGGMMASGGISDAQYNLGGYSDGGRLLRGPGDGVSDSIPAVIGKKQPARLADGEFVVPARIVSELGNGSTEAGARKLYAMMDRIQKTRGKTVGKGKVAKNSRADKYLPA